MDTHSSFLDLFINEDLHEGPLITRKSLPFQSLLPELLTVKMKIDEPPHSLFFPYTESYLITLRRQIWNLQQELRLQQMVFMLLQNYGFMSEGEALHNIQTMAETEAEPIKEAAAGLNVREAWETGSCDSEQWESVVSKFFETIDQKIKPQLKEFCLSIVHRLLQGNSYWEYDIFAFIYVILLKLMDLENLNPNMIAPVKKQMETLVEMLHFVYIIAEKETNLDEKLQNFSAYFGPWINIAAALVILYWVDEKDEELFTVVSPSLQKFNLSNLELVEAYILVFKALKPSNVSEILVLREAVGRFTDMVLENFRVSTNDHFEMLRDGLTLWTALLIDPPQADTEDEKLICAQTNLLVDEAESLILSLFLDKLGEDIVERRNILVKDFLEKINKAKAEVRQLHVKIPIGLSSNTIPQTNGRGFFNLLLGNLQKKLESEAKLFPFEKHLIATVCKELSFIRPFLMDIFELQDEHKELRDIWVQASNMAYLVDYVTDSCLSSIDVPVWSNLMHLSNAIEKIQYVKTEVSKIRKNDEVCNNNIISAKFNSKLVLPGQEQPNAASTDDGKVGFAHEEQRIIDRLIAGEVGLDIVAIVGMPGQGKTNLAQRVFQNSCIKLHFNKYAWCCISQAYNITRILKDILENVGEDVSPEQFRYLTQEDLADWLRKCLKGRRYLIVLDDMWDAEAWPELKLSFPDDNNGSRILLTSRNCNVALEAKVDCYIVELHPLSYGESWDLLRMKVFEDDLCPPILSDIGKTIAENCNGLPLAIVVVAGLLNKDISLDSWKQISKSLKSQIATEGCMNILELSYKHLPDYLKPCFLYLGAFEEDEIIDAKRLIQFWIAEGFVRNDGMKRMEVVAKEYLIDLVARSLVFVAKRSSRNGIEKCSVHDLLRQLCLIKAEEERFLVVLNMSDHSSSIGSDHYRLCVHDKWGPLIDSKPVVPGLRSLLVSQCRSHHPSYARGFFEGFKLVKVLDLGNIFFSKADFHEITQLIHLRLLAMAWQLQIPSSIVNLLRLEVLCLRNGGAPVILPSAVITMANLQHIFAVDCRIEYEEDFDKSCPPSTKLETFTSLDIFEESTFKRMAQRLPKMRKLGLWLRFCIQLSSYFKKLESLDLCIYGTEAVSPSTMDFPSTLKKLDFSTSVPLSGAMTSSIGKLSNLEVLKLCVNFEDKRWDVEDDEFLKLKYFELAYSSIQEWNLSDESFPCLEQLVVKYCKKIEELPSRFGAITTLIRIEVWDCNNTSVINSFQQIVDEQMDSGNEGLQFSIS